jgi:Na+-driven multidrug efflux pump
MPVVALGMSVAPIAGQNFGAKLADRVKHTYRDGVLLATAMMLALLVISQTSAPWLVAIFTRDPAAIAVGAQYLRIISWSFLASGVIFVTNSMFQAMGNTMPSVATSLVRIVLVAVPVLVLARLPGFALVTIWYLAALSVFVQLGLALLLLRREYGRRLRFAAAAPFGRMPDEAAVGGAIVAE